YGGPVLAEEFIEGREFTVGVLGNRPPKALPVVEVNFAAAGRGARGFYSHELKSQDVIGTECPANVEVSLAEELQRLAVEAFRALECSDCARVDFRVDGEGRPYILELNTLPGMKERYSDFPKAAAVAGYSYERLVLALLDLAAERHGIAAR
ncbi:MAG: D-alanine--D-alanine ligase, partial [Thermodesulfobacteriota bacterium]